jgi:hypothetical protein
MRLSSNEFKKKATTGKLAFTLLKPFFPETSRITKQVKKVPCTLPIIFSSETFYLIGFKKQEESHSASEPFLLQTCNKEAYLKR